MVEHATNALSSRQAKTVLWGGVDPPAVEAAAVRMDYRQLRKYIKR